jgi:2-amino-4-hydroxy-6-hydroxymethyldihydropteridine diphosphokinase
MIVYIGLGGNIGDPLENIKKAVRLIEEKGLAKCVKLSSMYKTEPVGYKDQPWFINAAAMVESDKTPEEFLAGTREIERGLGRAEKKVKDGPRPVDVDIIFWGSEIIDTDELKVPHPRMHQRGFVLYPLNEIAGNVVHPVLKKTVAELLDELDDNEKVEKVP